jgi:diaminopimelate epimerase
VIVNFSKYQGAGNDFVIIDNRTNYFDVNDSRLIRKICDRKFGVGADGLMLLQNKKGYNFEMVYFNSDGHEGTMCGNGGRCIVAYAYKREIINAVSKFFAIDGEHEANVLAPDYIKLKMNDVSEVEIGKDYFFMNTGSPHYIRFVKDLENKDVFIEGRNIRNSSRFKANGTNVNFVELKDNFLFVRTYERGVEDETLACGTGITASALAAALKLDIEDSSFKIKALGGNLKVSFQKEGDRFINIWLEGPAKKVFEGTLEL